MTTETKPKNPMVTPQEIELRDKFAGDALIGMLSSHTEELMVDIKAMAKNQGITAYELIADESYKFAAAMLRARSK